LLGPLALEWSGVIAPSFAFAGGELHVLPASLSLPEGRTLVLLVLSMIGTLVFPATILGAERDARTKAERQLILYARHLAELAPPEARRQSSPSLERSAGSIPP
jgi:hypothetical protein